MSIWRYLDQEFDTKTERDFYQRGYEDGLRDGQNKPSAELGD